MKIAIFSDNFYPEMSGISDSIISLARELAARGHKIVFYVPRYSRRDFAVSKLPFRELDLGENIEIFRLFSLPYKAAPTKQGRLVLPILSSYRHIKRFDPDIIYTQLFFGAGLEALLLSKLLKKMIVGTNHTPLLEFLKYAPVRWKRLENAGMKYVNWYYRHCVFVSAPCRALLSEMESFGFRSKSRVLSNPLELSDFSSSGSPDEKVALKKKFGLSEHALLYTGRLAQEKNIDVVLRAMAIAKKSIPDISCAITGHGSAEPSLRQLAKKLGIEESVHFLGYLECEEFSDVYRAADIFTVMSTAETQCLSMMHAFASGLPVIAADAYGLPEYVPKNAGFIVAPGDTAGLAERMVYLFSYPEEMMRLGENGRNFVREFSASAVANEWERIFRTILGEVSETGEPVLSIVIPAYNEEKFLETTLRTVLQRVSESRRSIEVIVVNNASTDRTREIALWFPGVVVVDEWQKGLSRARQAGFLASRGALIANIDADSLIPKGWIDRVLAEFARKNNLVALSGPYIYYDISPVTNFFIRLYYSAGFLFHLFNHHVLRSGALIQGGNFVLRRSALEKIGGFDVTITFFGEDTDIARRIQKEGRVRFTFSLPMRTSGRRLNREGVFRAASVYTVNHLWVLFFKRPFTKSFRDIR
ncbi:MAG: glycosyltransferase [Candidatus Moraniibacteriota bacterium]|nr:MAG: glycosyltransferase [Candidatus Moranbacteria bacterium]